MNLVPFSIPISPVLLEASVFHLLWLHFWARVWQEQTFWLEQEKERELFYQLFS